MRLQWIAVTAVQPSARLSFFTRIVFALRHRCARLCVLSSHTQSQDAERRLLSSTQDSFVYSLFSSHLHGHRHLGPSMAAFALPNSPALPLPFPPHRPRASWSRPWRARKRPASATPPCAAFATRCALAAMRPALCHPCAQRPFARPLGGQPLPGLAALRAGAGALCGGAEGAHGAAPRQGRRRHGRPDCRCAHLARGCRGAASGQPGVTLGCAPASLGLLRHCFSWHPAAVASWPHAAPPRFH